METRICRFSGRKFQVTEQERKAYARFDLPVPDIHPIERIRYVPAFYNAYVLAGDYLYQQKNYAAALRNYQIAITKVIATKKEEDYIKGQIKKINKKLAS